MLAHSIKFMLKNWQWIYFTRIIIAMEKTFSPYTLYNKIMKLFSQSVQEFNETKASKIMKSWRTSKAHALFSRSSINIAKKRQRARAWCNWKILRNLCSEIWETSDKYNRIADWERSTARREVLKLVCRVENIRVCNHIHRYDRDNSSRLESPTAQILFVKPTYVQRIQRNINT